jgi:allophanate hydrolase
LIRTTRTAVDYKLFALKGTIPEKPGLVRTPGYQGSGIEAEVWNVPQSEFGSFVELVPPPLSIGTCELIEW